MNDVRALTSQIEALIKLVRYGHEAEAILGIADLLEKIERQPAIVTSLRTAITEIRAEAPVRAVLHLQRALTAAKGE
jgi:hypothetical protein